MKVEGFSGKESACQTRDFNPWVGKIPWNKEWQPTSVFLPGKSSGQRSLAGYSPCDRKESDMPEQLTDFIYFHLQSNEKVYLKYKKARILGITWQSSSFTALSLHRARVQSPVKDPRVQ